MCHFNTVRQCLVAQKRFSYWKIYTHCRVSCSSPPNGQRQLPRARPRDRRLERLDVLARQCSLRERPHPIPRLPQDAQTHPANARHGTDRHLENSVRIAYVNPHTCCLSRAHFNDKTATRKPVRSERAASSNSWGASYIFFCFGSLAAANSASALSADTNLSFCAN